MTFTIEIGWFLAPLAITIVAFVWAGIATPPNDGNYFGNAVAGLFTYGAALIVSLIAWLIWAVLT